jgi:hypothetical protein
MACKRKEDAMPEGWGRAAAFLALAWCASCEDRGRAVVEDRGPTLARDVASVGTTTFAWLKGGAEIAYVSAGSQLVAVRVDDGTRRQLDPARASYQTRLARSRDGSALFFVAEDISGPLPRYTLREALSGKEAPVGEVTNGTLAVSADAHRVLYSGANGLSVLDASGTIFAVPAPCPGRALVPLFSPSGDQILCVGEHAGFVNVADGSTQTFSDVDPTLWRALHWDAVGPKAVGFALGTNRELVQLVDVTPGEAHDLYEPGDTTLLELGYAAISNDGRRVAFWESECLHAASLLSCEAGKLEFRLKVVDVSSRRAATVASGADGPGPILFSDDGTRIAYLFQPSWGELHVRSVP